MNNHTIDYTGTPGFSYASIVTVDGVSNTVTEFVRAGVLQPTSEGGKPFKFIQRAAGHTVGNRAPLVAPVATDVPYEKPVRPYHQPKQ